MSESIFSPDSKYIRTTGWGELAREVSPSFDYERLLENLNLLRYENIGTDEEVQAARRRWLTRRRYCLPRTSCPGHELVQIDLVTNAAELWASVRSDVRSQHRLAGERRPRRRVDAPDPGRVFSETVLWPAKPVVLFAHAPAAADLSHLADRRAHSKRSLTRS